MPPKSESLGKNLPDKGFIYDSNKRPFSDPGSSRKVVLAIQRAAHSTRIHPSTVDHRIGLLFSIAADMAHTMRSHGDDFWQVVIKQVAWTQQNKSMTPGIVKELTRHVMEGRLRWIAHGPNLPFSQLNTTAIAVDRFLANLKAAGMGYYIPVLEMKVDDPEHEDKSTDSQQLDNTKCINENVTNQPGETNKVTKTSAPATETSFSKRKATVSLQPPHYLFTIVSPN